LEKADTRAKLSLMKERKFNPALFARPAAGDGLALIQRCRALR